MANDRTAFLCVAVCCCCCCLAIFSVPLLILTHPWSTDDGSGGGSGGSGGGAFPVPASLTYAAGPFLYFNNSLSEATSTTETEYDYNQRPPVAELVTTYNGAAWVQARSAGGSLYTLTLVDAKCNILVLGVDLAAGATLWEAQFGDLNSTAQCQPFDLDQGAINEPSQLDDNCLDPTGSVLFVIPNAGVGYNENGQAYSDFYAINVTTGEVALSAPLPAGMYTVAALNNSLPMFIMTSCACTGPSNALVQTYSDEALVVENNRAQLLWTRVQQSSQVSSYQYCCGPSSVGPLFTILTPTMTSTRGEVYLSMDTDDVLVRAALVSTGEILWTDTYGVSGGSVVMQAVFDVGNNQFALLAYVASTDDLEVITLDLSTGNHTSRCPVPEDLQFVYANEDYYVFTTTDSCYDYFPPLSFYHMSNCSEAYWSPINGTLNQNFGAEPTILFMNSSMVIANANNLTVVYTLPPPKKNSTSAMAIAIGTPWNVTKFLLNPSGENMVECNNLQPPFIDANGQLRLASACSYPAYAAILTPEIPDDRMTWQAITAIVCCCINFVCVILLFGSNPKRWKNRGYSTNSYKPMREPYSPIADGNEPPPSYSASEPCIYRCPKCARCLGMYNDYVGPPAVIIRPAALCSVVTFTVCLLISFAVLHQAEQDVRLFANAMKDPMHFYSTYLMPCSGNATAFPPQASCFCSGLGGANSTSTGASFPASTCAPQPYTGPCDTIWATSCACNMSFFQYTCPCKLSVVVNDCSNCVPQLNTQVINGVVAAQMDSCSSAYNTSVNLLVGCLVLQFVYLAWLVVQNTLQLITGREVFDKPGTAIAGIHTVLNLVMWGVATWKLGIFHGGSHATVTAASYCTNKILAVLPGCQLTGAFVAADWENAALQSLSTAALLALPKPGISAIHFFGSCISWIR